MASGEIFYVTPSDVSEGRNPYCAAVLPLDDFQSVKVRVTPPFDANSRALEIVCEGELPQFEINVDSVISTSRSTMLELYMKNTESGGQESDLDYKSAYQRVVVRLLDRLGEAENFELFKGQKG